jgi:phage I-like protein
VNHRLVTAFASILPDGGLPNEIVYLPEGSHTITPYVDGKAQTITVNVEAAKGSDIAATLQTALDQRKQSNVRAWFDFEHKGGKASALPTGFRYEPGQGVMCALEWTGAGKEAIEGKDFSYFSPTFLIDESGIPAGLPNRGPLGALVNEPAFREIPRIAASDAVEISPNKKPIMKLLLAKLGIDPAHETAEQSALAKLTAMDGEMNDKAKRITELEAELADLKKGKDAAEAKCAAAAKDRAETLVKAAVADGRLAPKDEATQDKFRTKIEAGDTFAEEILAGMPKQHVGLDKPFVTSGTVTAKTADKYEGKTGIALLEAALAEELAAAK